MKKMQKEMKDVELQLGIVANQVRFWIQFSAILPSSILF
jgi:hypothetical protein